MTRTTPELAPPSPNFCSSPTGGRLATTYDLAYKRPPYTADLQWNRVSNLRPSGPEVETLPLGHRGLVEVANGTGPSNREAALWHTPVDCAPHLLWENLNLLILTLAGLKLGIHQPVLELEEWDSETDNKLHSITPIVRCGKLDSPTSTFSFIQYPGEPTQPKGFRVQFDSLGGDTTCCWENQHQCIHDATVI
ncbi:hypothetical protein AVEN_91465-1 [Araneus ventricosus]|uniref:Uncharacterized protein n=1 Tax=Araneus ventricosus TaxID=182803 RepID=A0A4Y2NG82_ARAVE|nr:hypothetical protein AVEN_91465-1 [Araneus ventricosus]